MSACTSFFFFFFNDRAPPEIYPLSLPAALPIPPGGERVASPPTSQRGLTGAEGGGRSVTEERAVTVSAAGTLPPPALLLLGSVHLVVADVVPLVVAGALRRCWRTPRLLSFLLGELVDDDLSGGRGERAEFLQLGAVRRDLSAQLLNLRTGRVGGLGRGYGDV